MILSAIANIGNDLICRTVILPNSCELITQFLAIRELGKAGQQKVAEIQ